MEIQDGNPERTLNTSERKCEPSMNEAMVLAGAADAPLDFGPLRIDTDVREVTVGPRVVELTRLEFDLLAHLAARPRHVFSRDQLLADVWNSSPDWQTPKTVTEHVRRLRNKMESGAGCDRWIRTVPGAGYRFEP
jgi:DNA-binding response OmpR family regulator